MALAKPLSFWGYLKWNYQGRYDLSYRGSLLRLWAVGPGFQFPGEKNMVVKWSKRVNEINKMFRVRQDPDGLISGDDTRFDWDDHSPDGPWAHNERVRAEERRRRMEDYQGTLTGY